MNFSKFQHLLNPASSNAILKVDSERLSTSEAAAAATPVDHLPAQGQGASNEKRNRNKLLSS
jgi:hypothetical protein